MKYFCFFCFIYNCIGNRDLDDYSCILAFLLDVQGYIWAL